MVLRVVNYVLMFMIAGVYALAVYASKNETELFHIIGVGNFALFCAVIFLLARKEIYYIWAAYTLSLVVYYAVISPYIPLIPEIIVYGTPSIVGLIAVYDIVILNSNELSVRVKARRTWPKKR
ncbi:MULTISPECIES: hypothetical protein [Morganellaceae]|uniref:Uncharacterized protein n=3 Tax=Morganellaceae TaxID=1903414 RepID=A0A1B8HMC3_9GAMM|nr:MULTISPECIES: hypothetical protein [Morganellaceae]OBU10474.1 hypothetical protein AYY17_15070 [Morganella psychrotolerans]QCJ72124.1 hypothetical protein C9446_20160 [Providencia heimbachae]UNH32437.1 hypothetical protein MNY72_17070 [Moellerella wisconsensis]UNH40900.1 hypothetical protein MNY70_16975 [Moellerella wisconsensis]UNH44240.1 hypothetical protein MNY66_15925 [Moellerella wisconsensis]